MKNSFSDYDTSSVYSDESGLEISTSQLPSTITLRPPSQSSSERTDSYRFSMANLEETHEAELDAILGELSLLECKNDTTSITTTTTTGGGLGVGGIVGTQGITGTGLMTGIGSGIQQNTTTLRHGRQHIRTNSIISSGLTNSIISTISSDSSGVICNSSSDNNHEIININRESRTDSPDNDSAFSDTVSLLSSESSASSGVSTGHLKNLPNLSQCDSAKAAKIHLALQKLEQASVRRLFVKAFTSDGASKSLLVDERMTCGHVTRLLSDKNHVQMEPNWSLVEHLTDLNMERLYEDHELLVDSLMLWSRDSKNRVMFLQRPDKIALFNKTERFLFGTQMAPGSEHDEHTRSMLLDEFFTTGGQVAMEGPLYLKTDSRKGWKRYHFVLRSSGLYYFPKEKTKSTRDLICLNSFVGYEVYKGIGWKKKHKSPTDFTFALRSPTPQTNTSKTVRLIKMMCAEDSDTLEKWVTNIRIAKYGKRVFDNHRVLLEDLARDELDKLSSARSGSIVSIISSVPSQLSTGSNNTSGSSNNSLPLQNGRLSRASSSSSSGCLSDDNNGFDSEFPTGTIKRKPSMKPNLPLTSMTRQLKEVGEITMGINDNNLLLSPTSPERGGTLTRRHSRRRSEESNNSGTLKRRQTSSRGSIESMNSSSSPSTLTPTSTPGTPCGTNRSIFTTNNNNINNNNINNNNNNKLTSPTMNFLSPMESMPSCMTDSVFSLPPPPEDMSLSASMMSLDSLPPPPPPNELLNDFSGSSMSLSSLPIPPPIDIKPVFVPASAIIEQVEPHTIVQQPIYITHPEPPLPQQIYSKSLKTSSLKSPPYKMPPQYNGSNGTMTNGSSTLPHSTPATKSVSFADSPVLLRRKVCFDDQVQITTISRNSSRDSIAAPTPPPRAEATRLSVPPKRLSDSVSNPPRDFLKDLQRVMRKKWQVAQKCKLEPATTPHEVLGFRDFNELAQSSNYYAESANVSNWVQEHYGSNCLYENLGGAIVADRMSVAMQQQQQLPQTPVKKRPPPPPPKRSESTQLTNRSQ